MKKIYAITFGVLVGGGGWYGGGGTYTAGGGGSNYTASSVSAVVHSQGFQTGNGQVLITTSSGIPSPGPITGSGFNRK